MLPREAGLVRAHLASEDERYDVWRAKAIMRQQGGSSSEAGERESLQHSAATFLTRSEGRDYSRRWLRAQDSPGRDSIEWGHRHGMIKPFATKHRTDTFPMEFRR